MKIHISEIILESINNYYPSLLPISDRQKYLMVNNKTLDKLINAVELYYTNSKTLGFLAEYSNEIRDELENLKFIRDSNTK